MADTKSKKLSLSSTKQEMLDMYNQLLKEVEEKKEIELKPIEKIKEKETKAVVYEADKISSDNIKVKISDLKIDIGKNLTELSEQIDSEISKYNTLKKAIEAKEAELKEIYEIDRKASTLAALIESQNSSQIDFEEEMESRKLELDNEIKSKKDEWENEKRIHAAELKERDLQEQKRRERDKEEFQYNFEKEKKVAIDALEAQKASLEKYIAETKESAEKSFTEREKALSASEVELNELRLKAASYQKDIDAAIAKAVKETSDKITGDAKHREELLQKEIEGERNVYISKISSLENIIKEQSAQLSKLSTQLEKSYLQVQDIAVKAVEGSSRKSYIPVNPNTQE